MEKYEPVFTKESVNQTRNPFIRLLRVIFYEKKITLDELTRLHYAYWRNNRREERLFGTHTGNLRRKLASTDKMTLRTFYYVLIDVLRFNIVRVRIDVRDADGNEKTYSSDTVVD